MTLRPRRRPGHAAPVPPRPAAPGAGQAAAPAGRDPGGAARPSLGPDRDLEHRRRPGDDAARHHHRSAVARALDPARRRARGDGGRGRRPADALRRSRAADPGTGRERRRGGALAPLPGARSLAPAARAGARARRPTRRCTDPAGPRDPGAREAHRRAAGRRAAARAAGAARHRPAEREAAARAVRVDARRSVAPCIARRLGRRRRRERANDRPALPQRARHHASSAGASRCCWPARVPLAARRMPMASIAAELGYASPSAFAAMVKRSVGSSPMRFFRAEA